MKTYIRTIRYVEYFQYKAYDAPNPKQLPPTKEMIRTIHANLEANSYKPFRKGAFKKKLSRKQRKSKGHVDSKR